VKKYVAWGIPQGVFVDFGTVYGEAQAALTAAKNDETRTPVVNARCKTAFAALTGSARDMKKRHFFVPPLTEADVISLGLKIHDGTPSSSGTPTAQVGQKACGFLSRSLRHAANSTQFLLKIYGWSFAKQNSQAIRR
jgi:hypothetical protein